MVRRSSGTLVRGTLLGNGFLMNLSHLEGPAVTADPHRAILWVC